jgi:hypothetical protein
MKLEAGTAVIAKDDIRQLVLRNNFMLCEFRKSFEYEGTCKNAISLKGMLEFTLLYYSCIF